MHKWLEWHSMVRLSWLETKILGRLEENRNIKWLFVVIILGLPGFKTNLTAGIEIIKYVAARIIRNVY